MAPTARKKACASDSWPLVPTSRLRPIAPMIAPPAANPVRSPDSSTKTGAMNSSTRASSSRPLRRLNRRRGPDAGAGGAISSPSVAVMVSDTGELLRPEQAGRADEQDEDHHDVRDDVAEASSEEQQLVLVARRHGLGDADDHPADERASGGVQAAEDGGGEGPERDGMDDGRDARR